MKSASRVLPPPTRGFLTGEFERRLVLAQAYMRNKMDSVGALLLTTQEDISYFSGLESQFWHSPTRPVFLVLPSNGAPIAVVPEILAESMRLTSWIQPESLRTWPAPVPEDDGVSLLQSALAEALARSTTGKRVGLPMSIESQLRMPVADLDTIRSNGVELVDAVPLIRTLRSVKSPAEQEKLRFACSRTSDAYESLPFLLELASLDKRGEKGTGPQGFLTERDVAREMRIELLKCGLDQAPYVIARSGAGGYPSVVDGPTDRALNAGDVLVVDTGSTYDGYWSDFDRNFYVTEQDGDQSIPAPIALAHEQLWQATEAGISAARPGATMADLHAVLKVSLRDAGVDASDLDKIMGCGRWGHGLGIHLTEWPSLVSDEHTVLTPGMVITIEPSLPLPGNRTLVHEEDILITEDGADVLSRRAPQEMARVRLPQ